MLPRHQEDACRAAIPGFAALGGTETHCVAAAVGASRPCSARGMQVHPCPQRDGHPASGLRGEIYRDTRRLGYMAKDNCFDVVSEVDMQEVDNAYQQTRKELTQRYDLKDSGSTIELDKSKGTITVQAPSEFVAKQVIDVLDSRLVKRGVDINSVKWGDFQDASGMTVRVVGSIVQGIDQETSKKISKDIKAQKLKVKVTIEGEKLRVSSPSRDTLQEVIAFLREQDYGMPLQFTNYR